MKYGILFSTISVLLAAIAMLHGGWYFLSLWPAISFGIVAVGYLFLGPSVYGKSQSGVLALSNTLLLLPYLLCLWSVWHLVRLFTTESPYDQLTDAIYIGRRLLSNELPTCVDHVVDLTCEFTEPRLLRSVSSHSFPILDGFVPETEQLKQWVAETASFRGIIYIHCAEGHGRTGLFTVTLLVQQGYFTSVDDALKFVKAKRPLVRLSGRQLQTLYATRTTI